MQTGSVVIAESDEELREKKFLIELSNTTYQQPLQVNSLGVLEDDTTNIEMQIQGPYLSLIIASSVTKSK